MKRVVIVGAVRTAVGTYGGSLKAIPSYELGGMVIKELLRRTGLEAEAVDEVVFGCAYQTSHYLNCARQALFRAEMPLSIPAYTVDRQCASGLQAICEGVMLIQTGHARIVISGGAENMSSLPYFVDSARWGYRLGHGKLYDWFTDASETVGGPEELFGYCNMGLTAENLAEKYQLSREEQDAYALKGHEKADRAIKDGAFLQEIMPMEVQAGKGKTFVFENDEHPRPDISLEKLARLRPVFKEDGTVTPGNSCGLNDGAAALLLMDEEMAAKNNLTPLVAIKDFASAGVHPRYMGLGPVEATAKVLKRSGIPFKEIGLIELNEAFAAQAIADIMEFKTMGLSSEEIINVNGGGIALGHPIGCTGARLMTTLIHEMMRRDVHYGLATLCVGGGLGTSIIVEKA
ncbi:MAG TPA: thiolase family protein [Deltaproteobacteria bacterium]|nr:thiolase family protein [Deltaproteobacteria bacterium]